MTIVNTETGEITDRPTHSEVRESIETTKSHLERAAEQVVWQIENRAWEVLGYSSWDEMREAEYKGAAVIVPPADRPELSSRLRATGMSHRSIAETIGVGETTVRRDNRQMADIPPSRTDSLGRIRPTTYASKATEAVPPSTSGSEHEDGPADQIPAGPSGVAAPSEPEPDPVGEFIEGSQSVQDARYLANFYKAITKASDYRVFDAERIGRIGDDADMRTLELAAKGAVDFFEAAKRARSGLRVIKGGRA